MIFTLTIDTDNAAFDGADGQFEVARILQETADRVESSGNETGTIRDINGNTVGGWVWR